jgi:hypothetical protein
VANDANGEPELFCKYYSSDSGKWSAQSLVKGVESFQVLYGVDTSNPKDGTANKFLTATAVNALDAALVLDGNTADEKAKDLNRKTFWKKITEIKIALLVSGAQNSRLMRLKQLMTCLVQVMHPRALELIKVPLSGRQIYLNQGEIEYEKYITRRFRFVMFVTLILTVTLAVLQIESNMFRLKIMSQTV